MPTATLEDRVTNLERRMSELEGQVGYLIPVVRQIHLDLLDFKEQVDQRLTDLETTFIRKFDQVDVKFNQVDARFNRLESRFDGLDAKVDAMPRAVAEIVVDLLKK